MIPKNQPAQIYDLNIGASSVGRNGSSQLTEEDKSQLQDLIQDFSEMFQATRGEKPALVNTDETSLKQALIFSQRIRKQTENLQGYAKEVIMSFQECLGQFEAQAKQENQNDNGLKLNREQIAQFMDIPEVLDVYAINEILYNEAHWTAQSHPELLPQLKNKVNMTQTQELIHACEESLFGEFINTPIHIYIQSKVDRYYLYWSSQVKGIDYATPSHYDIATQLSFDIPHNVAHLLHLSFADGCSAQQYIDRMRERKYTEAIAVLSEYQMYQQAIEKGSVMESFSEILSIPVDSLSDWVKQDRSYEFRLRLARLLSDVNTLNGKSFSENITDIQKQLGISQRDAISEAQKYYAWTGLGAAYTLGYNRLLLHGIQNARDAMTCSNGNLLLSWDEFFDSQKAPK